MPSIELGSSISVGAVTIQAHEVDPINRSITPGGTAEHEAAHAVCAFATGTSVKRATIIRSGDALGTTELSGYNKYAAAAGAAMGDREGAGFDLWMIDQVSGDSTAAVAEAERIVSVHRKEIYGVAQLIQEKGTVSGSEIHERMNRVTNGSDVIISITDRDGNRWEEREHGVNGGTIMVPNIDYSLNPTQLP